MRAVAHAHTILGWQENLTKDEMPPVWMWAIDDELETWFDEVEEARAEKYNLHSSRSNDKVVPMMSNTLAKNRRAR